MFVRYGVVTMVEGFYQKLPRLSYYIAVYMLVLKTFWNRPILEVDHFCLEKLKATAVEKQINSWTSLPN